MNMPDIRVRNIPMNKYRLLKILAIQRGGTLNDLMLNLIQEAIAHMKDFEVS